MPEITDVRPISRYFLGLDALPYDAVSSVAWTEVPASKVRDRTLRWGAQHELNRVEASYCALTLDNVNGDFDRNNPARPYYPKLRPLNRLRVVDRWPPNLLTPNQASIETDTSGWSAVSNCAIARSTAAAAEGFASLALTATAAGQMVAAAGLAPVLPGTAYTAHAEVQAGVGTQSASASIWWYDALGAFISGSNGSAIMASTGGFLAATATGVAPANAANAAVIVGVVAAAGGDVGYVDKVSLRPGTSTGWLPGGVDYNRCTLYVSGWPLAWNGISSSVVQIEAYDISGAILNAEQIPGSLYELQVRKLIEELPSTGKAVWLRLGETGSATVAADSSGYALDGQYQGTPTLGLDGLIIGDADKAVRFVASSRASLPYKNLITGYPFTVACVFRCEADVSGTRMILSAYDGVTANWRQFVQLFIESEAPAAGKIIAEVANLYPNGTQVNSTITVNDGITHRLVWVATSATSYKLYIDGTDRTAAIASNAHDFPNDLNTGYGVGNNPAATFGDWPTGQVDGDLLDEVLILDGVALTAQQVSDLSYSTYAASPLLLKTTGQQLSELLLAIGVASSDLDIDTGLTIVQGAYVAGSALAYAQRLDVTEGGRMFVTGDGQIAFRNRHALLQPPYTVSQATFGEGAGKIGYWAPLNYGPDDQDLWNDVPVANTGQATQVARDATSIASYGRRTLQGLTDLLGTSTQEAKDRANRDLALYKDPISRVRDIEVHPQHEDPETVWPALLGLVQDSRVTVEATPPGSPMFGQDSFVEHYDETVTGKDWIVKLRLSPTGTQGFWVLGTSALGSGSKLAY